MTYIEEATIQGARLIRAIEADPKISKATKKTTTEYVNFLKANGLNDRTITKRLYLLSIFYKTINGRDVTKLSREDVIKSIATIEKSKYAGRTKEDIKFGVKALLKHAKGSDEEYPKEVRWLKPAPGSYKKVLPEDILTESDVLQIMNAITDVRDLALCSVLYDGGLRIGELLAMRVKDVDLNTEPAHIRVRGKTGERQVPIFFSAPYLGAYMNTYKNSNPESPLWLARGSWSDTGRRIDRAAVAKMLKKAAQKAGISKPINPHAWRKASATRYANSLSDQVLKNFYGWTPSSRMPEVYVSLSGKNIDGAVAKANGVKIKESEEPTKLKSKTCPKCRYTANGVEMLHCGRCGAALDIAIALKEEQLQKLVNKSAVDPDYLVQLVDAAVEERLNSTSETVSE